MSRKKTEINPLRAERVKTLIDKEGISQKEFAKKTVQTQQNVSRIIQQKQPLTEENARHIIKIFPGYRLEWLLGYDDFMTESDIFDHYVLQSEETHDKNISTIRFLSKLKNIQFVLFDSGFLNENGECEDRFIVRKDGHEGYMTYSEVSDLIDDLSALTESRLSRILK